MAYGAVSELARRLNIRAPTREQADAMEQMLEAAAQEIDWDLGYTADNPAPDPAPPLIVEVNYDRARELWELSFSPFGWLGVGSDTGAVPSAGDSWRRYHIMLQPLRDHEGVA